MAKAVRFRSLLVLKDVKFEQKYRIRKRKSQTIFIRFLEVS